MQFLATISFKIILLSSFLIMQGKGLASGQDTTQAFQLPFSDTTVDSYLYKTSMKFYKNTLTGIFVIKPQKNSLDAYRVVFLSELGMKYFDFTVSLDSFIVNQCILPLNKDRVLSILEDDLRLILLPCTLNEALKTKHNPSKYIFKSGKETYTIFMNSELYYKKRKNMISGAKVFYSDYIGTFIPNQIVLKHGFLNIEYEFNLLKPQE